MKETILTELNKRKLGIEREIKWYKNNTPPELYYILFSLKDKLTELKDIIFYVEGL